MLILKQKRSTGRQWTTQEQAQVGSGVLLTKYTRDDLLTRQVDTERWREIHTKGANEKHNRTNEGKTSK